MVFNLMFGLGKEAPIQYTEKYYKQLNTKINNKLTVKIKTNKLKINISDNKFVIGTKDTNIKTELKTRIKLKLVTNG